MVYELFAVPMPKVNPQWVFLLYRLYDNLRNEHEHGLVKKENLTAGTGYDIVYTNMIKDSAMLLSEKWNK